MGVHIPPLLIVHALTAEERTFLHHACILKHTFLLHVPHSAAIEEASEAEEDDAEFEANDFTLEGAMDMDALDAAAAEMGEAAEISIDLVGAALDAIPGVGEVLLAAEVRVHL